MAFPQTPLDLKVHAKIGGSWTDISADVQYEQAIQITHGAQNEAGRADSSTCTLHLLNTSGNYSPANPNGTYFPNFTLGTPLRVSVLTGERALLITDRRNQHAATVDAAALDITGDIDVRIEMDIFNGSMSGYDETVELIGKADGGGQASWWLGIEQGYPKFYWSADGSNVISAATNARLIATGSSTRVALRATLDVNNGLGGITARFYRSDTIDGVWEEIGDGVVTTGGTSSIFNSTAPLRIADATAFIYHSPLGRIFKASVRNGIGGTEVANPDFTSLAEGTTSFTDAAGRSWNVFSGAEVTQRKIRFSGEITSIVPSRQRKGFKYVQVEASGIMNRLGQNAPQLQSAMFRDLSNPARTGIVGYWPLEDGTDSTDFGSGLPGHPAATVNAGTIDRAAYSLWAASSPLPTFGTAGLTATVPYYAATNEISMRIFVAIPSTNIGGAKELFRVVTDGTASYWTVQSNASGDLRVLIYDSSSTLVHDSGNLVFSMNGVQRIVQLNMVQNGANVDWSLTTFDLNNATISSVFTSTWSNTLAGYTKGTAKQVKVGSSGDLMDTAMGQIAVANSVTAYSDSNGALVNYDGEATSNRMTRLAAEEEFLLASSGYASTAQGGQGETDILTLLRDAATADGGILCELRDCVGFLYRSTESLSSQAPALTLTYTPGSSGPIVEPFNPVIDNDVTVNDYIAKRRDGGFSRVEQTTGSRSVNDYPDGVGRYPGEDTYNLFYDSDTLHAAGWAVNLGTSEDPRVSQLNIMLEKATGLIESSCDTYVGDVIEISGLPTADFGTDTLQFMVRGYRETVDQFSWVIRYALTPAGPWRSGFALPSTTSYDENYWSWADTEGSELSGSLSSSATTTDILTTSGDVWTSEAADSPYDLKVGGEVVRVSGPGGLLNSNPFFTTDLTGWSVSGGSSTIARDTANVMTHPYAVASIKLTPDGATATVSALGPRVTVLPNARYTGSAWLMSPTGYGTCFVKINWYTSGGAFISTSTGSTVSLTAGVWTHLTATDSSPSTAGQAEIIIGEGGTPAASNILYGWAPRCNRLYASTVYDEFARTSTGTWSSADSGQAWTNSGGAAADYDVLSGYGRHINAATSTGHHSVITAVDADFDIQCDITTAALSTGASQLAGIITRYTNLDNLYEARLEFTTANAVVLSIRKRVAAVETQLGTFTTSITHTAGTYVRVRFQGYGSTLRAKAYLASTVIEPTAWDVSVTDSAITGAGSLGVKSVRAAGNTNASADFRFDNYRTLTPQTFTIQRSMNGVVKSHSANAAISLAYPAYAGR